jgi:hypothetical protein
MKSMKPGGVRLTPHELRFVFARHDVRQAVSWQIGYFIAVFIGGLTARLSLWLFLPVALFYAVTAVKAHLRWKAQEREDQAA